MNIVEKAPVHSPSSATDFDRFRLRRFVESLPDGELETHAEPLDLADIAPILEGNARAVLFRAVGPSGRNWSPTWPAAGPGSPTPSASNRANWSPRSSAGCATSPNIFEVPRAQAPAQQVVLEGDEADLTKLPVHLGHGADGGPYISASVDFVVDPRTGIDQCRACAG